MDDNLKRSIILEHYQNPHNRGIVEDNKYKRVNMNNESCIDEVDVMMKIENGKIEDVKFEGEACAMCISSSSIMTDTLRGKTVKEASSILNNFLNMVKEKPYDEKVLDEAIVYSDISKSPNREKCVLLPWWGAEKILNQLNSDTKER